MVFLGFGKKKAQRHVLGASGAQSDETVSPTNESIKKFLDEDAVLASNLRRLVDNVLIEAPEIEHMNGKKVPQAKLDNYNEQLNDVRFHKIMRSGLYGLIWNGNLFFEYHQVGNRLTELYVIDPETVKVIRDRKGDVLEYKQKTSSGDITLNKNRIIHITMDHISTGVWGQSFIKPLEYVLNRKRTAENYLAGMIYHLAPVVYLKTDSLDEEEAIRVRNELRSVRDPTDPLKLITLGKDEDVGRSELGSTAYFDAIQSYIDTQNDEIIRILQTPPIVAGTVDNSNRSNSEIQARYVFANTIFAWQNFLVKELNNEVIKRLGWKDVTFSFPVTDEREMEQALIRANKFKELGYSQDAIHEYLERAGIKIKADFQEIETEAVKKDIDDMPSRQPRPSTGIPQNEEERLNARKNGMERKVN